MYVKIVFSMLRTKWCVCRPHCTDIEHEIGESEIGPWACLLELYVVDEIEGVFMFLRFFVDDCDMSLENLDLKIF